MDKQGPGSPNTLLGDSDALSIRCGTADLVAGRVEPGTAPMKRRADHIHALIPGPEVLDGHEHYPGCPCSRCHEIRASRPQPAVPLCYFPCCGATVKLVRTIGGGYSVVGKETHNTHCKELAA